MFDTDEEGPIAQYLRATGQSREWFDGEVRKGDRTMALVLTGEVLYRAIRDLIAAVESGGNAPNLNA